MDFGFKTQRLRDSAVRMQLLVAENLCVLS
jgi:hypothetical protein